MTADIGEVLYELMIVDRPVSNHGNRYFVITAHNDINVIPLSGTGIPLFLELENLNKSQASRPVSNHGNRYFVITVNCKLYKFPLLVDTFVVF
jgi:hypothetical protein